MALNPLPTTIIFSHSRVVVSRLYLDEEPQPGTYLEVEGHMYLVLERRHRYLLKLDRYCLNEVVLSVQRVESNIEKSLLDGRWVIGDIGCRYNARSELIRCAVNPNGPCDRCVHYQSTAG